MNTSVDYEEMATNLIKSELARRGMNFEDLRVRLEQNGVNYTRNNLAKKIGLGKFSFAFFLKCAEAMAMEKLQLK